MFATLATILPSSYFDGLSTLWGGSAYIGSAIVAAALVFQMVHTRPDAGSFVWLLAKLLLIGLSTVFLREWLMRLNDVLMALAAMMGVDPRAVDNRFINFVAGKTPTSPDSSVWDIIWGTESVGTAISYALLWLFGWMAWCVQYVVKLIGGVLLTAGWSISPIFLSFFMLRSMQGVAHKFLLGLIALVCWPFGWVMAAVVTNAMLDAAALANLIPVVVTGTPMAAPALTVLLIGAWMLVSSLLAPWITTKVLLMAANPAAAFVQGMGGVMQAALSGGVGAGVAMATAGAGTSSVIAASALGAMSSGSESAVRGGNSARTTNTAVAGLSGFYQGQFVRRNTEATEAAATAHERRASASETVAAAVLRNSPKTRRSRSGFDSQPHDDDPNKSALDI